jgi:hypothetical protein
VSLAESVSSAPFFIKYVVPTLFSKDKLFISILTTGLVALLMNPR